MIVKIPSLLSAEELQHCQALLRRAPWTDGRLSAGEQARVVKKNIQVAMDSPEFAEMGDLILRALGRNALFNSCAIPLRVRPPMFNRYDEGMSYGAHIDGAIHHVPGAPRMRADLSATLFLTTPQDYDGGELIMHEHSGNSAYKLDAGDLILYPTNYIHSVNPVTRGSRLAAFFWIQSIVKPHEQRQILFELDQAIIRVRSQLPDSDPAVLALTNSYHNLLRLAAEL